MFDLKSSSKIRTSIKKRQVCLEYKSMSALNTVSQKLRTDTWIETVIEQGVLICFFAAEYVLKYILVTHCQLQKFLLVHFK
jgi:hypothetical protein